MTEEQLKMLTDEFSNLISQLGIESSLQVKAEKEEEEGEAINVQIDSAEAASLIGFHGETMQALQLIFSFLCHKKLGLWCKVAVNVGDYRQKREEQLEKLALNLAMKAKFSGETQILPNLNSSERRFVHIVLANNPDVFTESEGEGRQRVLTIKPKTQ